MANEDSADHEVRRPLVGGGLDPGGKGDQWMVYLSTFVAVCGSYEFGCCVSAWMCFYLALPLMQQNLVIFALEKF